MSDTGVPTATYPSKIVDRSQPSHITLALMVSESHALGEAVLQDDLDEARFRTHLLAVCASALGLQSLSNAAARLGHDLGPVESAPGRGYGASLLLVADELETLGVAL